MESDDGPNESRTLDWKSCFKKILAPELLKPSNNEGESEAPHPSNPCNWKENATGHHLNPPIIKNEHASCPNNENSVFDSVGNITFRGDPEKSENVQRAITSSIMAKSENLGFMSQSFLSGFDHLPTSDSPNSELDDFEDPDHIVNIINADAEELAKRFSSLKLQKKNKYSNRAESSHKAPNWNIAFKKVLDPQSVPDDSLKTPEETEEKKTYLLHPELLESVETHPYTYHRLCRDDDQPSEGAKGASNQLSTEKLIKKRIYTEEEKKVIKILQSARNFKLKPKPHVNVFDGAGIDCFKGNENRYCTKNIPSQIIRKPKIEKPKKEPPPGGYVCIKPLTAEEIRQRPVNVIFSECWDYDEDY